jgi:dTDP-4-dehydrorhamnose 3,5-epimerase-like enzyme
MVCSISSYSEKALFYILEKMVHSFKFMSFKVFVLAFVNAFFLIAAKLALAGT